MSIKLSMMAFCLMAFCLIGMAPQQSRERREPTLA